MWTNPSQKSRQGSDPPPIQAMPAFWEHLDREPLPYDPRLTFMHIRVETSDGGWGRLKTDNQGVSGRGIPLSTLLKRAIEE